MVRFCSLSIFIKISRRKISISSCSTTLKPPDNTLYNKCNYSKSLQNIPNYIISYPLNFVKNHLQYVSLFHNNNVPVHSCVHSNVYHIFSSFPIQKTVAIICTNPDYCSILNLFEVLFFHYLIFFIFYNSIFVA